MHVRKYTDLWGIRRLEIALWGLKVRFPYGNWKAYRQKKKQRRHEKRQKKYEKITAAFREANQAYLAHKKDHTIRRLFFTSGNLQLINAMAIISQLAENEKKSSINHIIVQSSVTNDDFEKANREMAALCGPHHHYYFCCGGNWNPERFIKYIIKHRLEEIDEVYCLRLWTPLIIFETLYRSAKCIVMDEGAGSLIPADRGRMRKYCRKMLTTFFLGKLDYVSFPGRPWSVEHIQQEYFDCIANKCASLYPWELPFSEKKYIIFCGTYAASFFEFTEEEMMSREEQLIQKLIDKGYHVLYKPHPRDPVKRHERDGFTILHTRLPLECYQLNGVYAIVSLRSCASLQSYHYCKVPGFIDAEFCSKTYDPPMAIMMNDYTPPVDLLLEVDARDMKPDELRREIELRYERHMADKPLLSQNERFSKAYIQPKKSTK